MPPIAPTFSLRACRRLHSRKERRETGRFLAEGIRPVLAALRAGTKIDLVLYTPELFRGSQHAQAALDLALSLHIPCQQLTKAEFGSLATRDNPQGIACVGRQAWSSFTDLSGNDSSIVALYAPQDPGNLGTIIRTCDATNTAGIVLIGESVDPWHPGVIRASMGAIFDTRLVRCSEKDFARWAPHQDMPVIGASDRGSADYASYSYPEAFVLLMGSERQGLPSVLEDVTTKMVRIPMAGEVDSLNLAIATSLILYEAWNDRRQVHAAMRQDR